MKKLVLISAMLISMISCTQKTEDEKPVKGCTDPIALNFDTNANENCCCEYNAKLTFYIDAPKSMLLRENKPDARFVFMIDGTMVGMTFISDLKNEESDCNDDKEFSFNYKLDKKMDQMTITIMYYPSPDDNGIMYNVQEYVVKAGCNSFKIY